MTVQQLKDCLNTIPPEFNKTEVQFCKMSEFGFYTFPVEVISYGETSKRQFVYIKEDGV